MLRHCFEPEIERLLEEAPGRLALHRFEQGRRPLSSAEARRFLEGYRHAFRGGGLELAVDHFAPQGRAELVAFAYGWATGWGDFRQWRPDYRTVARWLWQEPWLTGPGPTAPLAAASALAV